MSALTSLNNTPFLIKLAASYTIVYLIDLFDLLFSGDLPLLANLGIGLMMAVVLSLNKYLRRVLSPREIESGKVLTEITMVEQLLHEGNSEIIISTENIMFLQEEDK